MGGHWFDCFRGFGLVEKIKVTRCEWSIEAEAALIVSMGEGSEILANQVKKGIAELWHFENDDSVDIWAIVRRERKELVVCCLEGIGSREVVPLIEKAAKRAGCETIRAHTKRKALNRMFPSYELKEYVYRKVL